MLFRFRLSHACAFKSFELTFAISDVRVKMDDLFTIGKVILQNLITFKTSKHGVDSNQSIKGIC